MKSLLKAFPIIFFIFSNNYIKAAGINCSSPVHKNKTICKGQSKKESKIDPKELIGKVTVSIVGINGDKYPGSGVIVRKEGNIYIVLTAAHVVCNLNNQSVNTEEF